MYKSEFWNGEWSINYSRMKAQKCCSLQQIFSLIKQDRKIRIEANKTLDIRMNAN